MVFFSSILIFLSSFICSSTYELSEEKISKLDEIIESQMKMAKLNTLGLIVTNKSSTIYQKIYGDNDKVNETTPFVLGSVSKSFTTLGLLKLNVQLNKTLNEYNLKDYISEEDGKNIHISELLNHTSGLISFGPKVNNENKGKFVYSNYGFALLGKIIELESGKKYSQYMKEAIFNPLNMSYAEAIYRKEIADSYDNFLGIRTKYTGLESEIGDGFYVPAGFISASIEDMGKYLRLFLNTDSDDYKKYISQMIKRSINIEYNIDYGMGLFILKKNKRILYMHPGDTNSFSSYLYVYPEEEVGIFLITNSNDLLCSIPKNDLFKNIESFLVFDTVDGINSGLFFHIHFSYNIIFIIIIAIPLIYLVITIIRKFKKKKYLWFTGCKGVAIFIIELILLFILPAVLLIVLYTFDDDTTYFINNSKDIKFVLFTFCSALMLTFIIKIVYVFVFNKCFNSHGSDDAKKIEPMNLDYLSVEDEN